MNIVLFEAKEKREVKVRTLRVIVQTFSQPVLSGGMSFGEVGRRLL